MWVGVCAAALLTVAAASAARADQPSDAGHKPKASSFAPHPSKSHVYGTPISKPILHKQKKRPQRAATATTPAAPIK